MKYFYFLFSFLLLLSCQKQQEELFDQPASQRLTQANAQYKKILEEHSEGWLLNYYLGSPRSGGYNYILTFADGKVSVLSETSPNTPTESLYTIVDVGGPMLSFDLFNTNLMDFATPNSMLPLPNVDTDFNILSYTDGVFSLRGPKSQKLMTLTKFTGDKQAFFQKTKQAYALYSSAGIGEVGQSNQKIDVLIHDRDVEFKKGEEVITQAYVPTAEGFKLYQPITIGGETFDEFTLSPDKQSLVYSPQGASTPIAPCPIDFSKQWNLMMDDNATEQSAEFSQIHAKTGKEIEAMWPNEVLVFTVYVDFGRISKKTFGLRFYIFDMLAGDPLPCIYNMEFKGVVGHPDWVDFIPVSPYSDTRLGSFWQYFPPLQNMVNYLSENAPYKAIPMNVGGVDKIKLVSQKNPNAWFFIGQY